LQLGWLEARSWELFVVVEGFAKFMQEKKRFLMICGGDFKGQKTEKSVKVEKKEERSPEEAWHLKATWFLMSSGKFEWLEMALCLGRSQVVLFDSEALPGYIQGTPCICPGHFLDVSRASSGYLPDTQRIAWHRLQLTLTIPKTSNLLPNNQARKQHSLENPQIPLTPHSSLPNLFSSGS
jgi:hypothetical protein